MSDLVGSLISHYRIVGLLGQGGMGVVYRAHDEKLGRDLALKVLPATSLPGETERARLMREARTASRLNDPHIVHVYEVGEDSGRDFIAMELVEGRTLREAIPASGLPTETVFRYGQEIAQAIACAHEHGVVHRDLKTSNIMLTGDGHVKILDFGLARHVPPLGSESSVQDIGVTSTGVIVGTLSHLSPEVLRGTAADPRSDVWALGVVLYEMASGKLPFHGDSSSALVQSIERDPPPPLGAQVPSRLRAVISRCLARDPSQRYRNASEIRIALESAQRESQGSMRARTRVMGWSAAALAVAVVGFLVARGLPGPKRPPDPPRVVAASAAPAARKLDVSVALLRLKSGQPEALADGDAVRTGDHLAMNFSSQDSCYVYVFDEDERGHAYVLFPLAGLDTQNPLPGSSDLRLPGTSAGDTLSWSVTSAGGTESIYVIASRARLDELERTIAKAPHARAPGESPYPPVGQGALLALRGIGGLVPEGSGSSPGAAARQASASAASLGQLFPALKAKADSRTDLWARNLQFRSLPAGATRHAS